MIWESGSTALQVWHLSLIRRLERIESGTLHVKSASWMGRPQVLIVLTGKPPMFPTLVGGRTAIFHAQLCSGAFCQVLRRIPPMKRWWREGPAMQRRTKNEPRWWSQLTNLGTDCNYSLVGHIPIGSMYGIYGNIYHQYTPNVSIYTGSCGIGPPSPKSWSRCPLRVCTMYLHSLSLRDSAAMKWYFGETWWNYLKLISKVGRVMSSPTYFFKVRCG